MSLHDDDLEIIPVDGPPERRAYRSKWNRVRDTARANPGQWFRAGPVSKSISASHVARPGRDHGLAAVVTRDDQDGKRYAWVRYTPPGETPKAPPASASRPAAAPRRPRQAKPPTPTGRHPVEPPKGEHTCPSCDRGPFDSRGELARHRRLAHGAA